MVLLVTEADKLSEDVLERGVIEEVIDRDALFALLQFMAIEGKSYNYVREGSISSSAFLDPYEAVPEAAATFTEVQTKLRIIAEDVDIDKFIIRTKSDLNNQVAIQLAAKAKKLGRTIRSAIVNGDSAVNAKSFDGVRKLTPAGQTLLAATNGTSVTFEMLDQLLDLVDLGADVLMMRSGTWRAIRQLLRVMGGNEATQIQIPNFGYPVPAYDGIPVIINDFLPIDETAGTNSATTSIYAMRLNEVDGFHMITAPNMAGMEVEDIGTVQNKDSHRYRVKWYVGTALKATHAIARLRGITNI